jgi:hypothetical protein
MQLTAQEACELLDYSPTTGHLYWKVNRGSNLVAGQAITRLSNKGYIVVKINKKLYSAHRIAWLMTHGVWPIGQIDHENHIRSDNRLLNLYDVSQQINLKNKTKMRNNTSGHTGVCQTRSGNWLARICANKTQINLGTFPTIDDAIIARNAAMVHHNFNVNHGL